MSKGKSTWKYNKLLTARRNYYADGGPNIFLKAYNATSNWVKKNPEDAANVALVAGLTIGGAIGGGLLSGAGNVIGGLSNIASAIPGHYGKLASAALGIVGGVTNAAFGSKINEENVAEVEANIDLLNNFKSDASDYDTLSANYAMAPTEMEFTDRFIGKNGWFNNTAGDLANNLRTQLSNATNRVLRTLINNALNIALNQASSLEANYAAEGGKIEIDPKNKGKFNATKKRTGKTTEELTHSKNPLTRRRAIFALNAAKWHHTYGGNLFGNGGDVDTTRVDFFSYVPSYDRGFIPENMELILDSLIARRIPLPQRVAILSSVLHESGGNPSAVSDTGKYRGILLWGSDRYPNTEDMAELIHYLIESSQNSSSPNWTHGGGGYPKINTSLDGYKAFWNSTDPEDAAMYYNKGYVRPKEMLARINRAKEAAKMYKEVKNKNKNKKAFGGILSTHGADFSTGITSIDNGGTHELNPNEGVQLGIDSNGIPNLVEEGETIFNDFVFSKRINVPKAVRNKYKLRGEKSISFADASKKLAEESKERPNDPISLRGLEAAMTDLALELELIKAKRLIKLMPVIAAYGGNLFLSGGNTYQRTFDLTYLPNGFIQEEVVRPPLLPDDNNYTLGELPELVVTARKPIYDLEYAFQDPITRMRNEIAAYTNSLSPSTQNTFTTLNNTPTVIDSYNLGELPELTVYPKKRKKARSSTTGRQTPKSNKQLVIQLPIIPTEDLTDYTLDNNQIPIIKPKAIPTEDLYDTSMDVLTSMPTDESLRTAGLNNARVTQLNQSTSKGNNTEKDKEKDKKLKPRDTSLLYAPIVAQAGSVLTDALGITNKADYSNAARVAAAARGLSDYNPVKYTPSGTYLTYRPFDRDYYLNKYNAASAATRRNIMNTSSGNRATAMAGLLAADTNYLNQIGELGIKAELYNRGQELQVASFNRATDEMNARGYLQADMANLLARANANRLAYEGLAAAALMREAERLGVDATKAANISGLATSLGDLGKFNANLNSRDFMMSYMNMTPELRELLFGYRSEGGKINRKKRKGLTI